MTFVNQPRENALGTELEALLNNNEENQFTTFYILVAYARRSGVERIKPFIERFKEEGGEVKAVVGIDQKNTSIQALRILLTLCDELFVYHSERLVQTFHPKVYAFEKEDEKGVLFVGSGNLTAGGLYTNYEAVSYEEYDLSGEEGSESFQSFKEAFEQYSTPSDCSKVLDEELLERLIEGNYLANEEVENRRIFSSQSSDTSEREPVFGTESFREPEPRVITASEEEEGEVTGVNSIDQGFWKKLSSNDVSLSSSPGQMIIPKKFLNIFPPFTDWEIKTNGARQAAIFFNLIFINEEGERIRLDKVRVIQYVPAPDHPRPNTDVRFTFRNREILENLEEDDILEFRRTDNPDVWFIVRHIKPGTDDYENFGDKRYDFI